MGRRIDPYIETFRHQAQRLDELNITTETDAPMLLLAQFMSQIEDCTAEHDLFTLAEIGGHLYREGLRRQANDS